MTITQLRAAIRLAYCAFMALLAFYVYVTAEQSPVSIAVFQLTPLLLVSPLLIQCRPKHMHLVLPIVMMYLCFSAPNLFIPGIRAQLAGAEIALNLVLSCTIMWYLLQSSKLHRQKRNTLT